MDLWAMMIAFSIGITIPPFVWADFILPDMPKGVKAFCTGDGFLRVYFRRDSHPRPVTEYGLAL